jgi:hypothetical protein
MWNLITPAVRAAVATVSTMFEAVRRADGTPSAFTGAASTQMSFESMPVPVVWAMKRAVSLRPPTSRVAEAPARLVVHSPTTLTAQSPVTTASWWAP